MPQRYIQNLLNPIFFQKKWGNFKSHPKYEKQFKP